MNWIKENKFLSGFLAITLVVAGVLGFLMVSAMGRASTVQTNYDTAAAELTRLQNSAPFPDADNLAKMQALKKQHKAAIEELQTKLAATQIALQPGTTPVQFQDKLKEVVTQVKAAATANGVKLPDKFYMSFDRFETETPKPEAAAPLLRLLESMKLVVEMLIANNVTEISELKHEALPEEAGAARNPAQGGKPEKPDKAPSKDDSSKLVTRHPFEVAFVAHEGKFHKFINSVITEKKQFFIPKSVVVKNEKEAPPTRATPPKDKPADGPAGEDIVMIVGEEKLQVTVKIDVVDFAGAPPVKGEKAEKAEK